MLAIGTLSQRTGVKVPTIRYYEEIGLLAPPGRSAGGQRRYGADDVARLRFIRHARDLGFGLEAIRSLLDLAAHPDRFCAEANALAMAQLRDVQARVARLRRLEGELQRIVAACDGGHPAAECGVLDALADHDGCTGPH